MIPIQRSVWNQQENIGINSIFTNETHKKAAQENAHDEKKKYGKEK